MSKKYINCIDFVIDVDAIKAVSKYENVHFNKYRIFIHTYDGEIFTMKYKNSKMYIDDYYKLVNILNAGIL